MASAVATLRIPVEVPDDGSIQQNATTLIALAEHASRTEAAWRTLQLLWEEYRGQLRSATEAVSERTTSRNGSLVVNGDRNLAIFCDFENIALGARDAKYARFNMQPVLQKLLLKGSIVVKKAYCDWDRYKEFKATMHEAAFELIEIPHARQSGKNSADIRMVVDALDLCYTKEHIDTFVIISGDSDFSPLVSKLRENAKTVIGVGVKSSTSDLLMSNCDEFILYDDLVAKRDRVARPRRNEAGIKTEPAAKSGVKSSKGEQDRAREAIDLVRETIEALYAEKGDTAKLWGSMIKQTLKRRQPSFNESYYGFASFNELLEEAQVRGELELELDERSRSYVVRNITQPSRTQVR